jgi:hypothetical protein
MNTVKIYPEQSRSLITPYCNRCTYGQLQDDATGGLSRRTFLGRVGAAAALSALAGLGAWPLRAVPTGTVAADPLPFGRRLRVQPLLVYHLDQRREKTSWRSYGGLRTAEDVTQESERLGNELNALRQKAEFPVELLPLTRVTSLADAQAAAQTPADALLVFGASGAQNWLETLAASKKPNILFVRHKSGPVYLWYEIAHWRLLRKSEDAKAEPNLGFEDVVVDEYDDVLWRWRALYGLMNARGTKMLAIGGLAAYSRPGQELGPVHAKQVWGYEIVTVPFDEIKQRLEKARADETTDREARRRAEELLALPNVALETDRRFVVNTFLAAKVFRDLMVEHGAANLGVADCMGGLIPILDTPPCLALSLLNDEGLTAFCHTDLTHTMPGVLLRWISNKPSFVCNSHFPHHGVVTLAHCAAPRKMNGRDYEPTTVMTHYESDYGAATKVHYPKGQVVTCLVPNLHCTKWFAFRGTIADSPSFDMCRSQMDVQINGDWRRLLNEMEGFHTIVCYGDYLREVGYAVQKTGSIEWLNYSEQS